MHPKNRLPLYISEFLGTALLLGIGLSFVILNWGQGSVVAQLIPSESARRAITGFLFGTTGCLITLSGIGRMSGAHINPVVSLAFWLRGKLSFSVMIGYVISQMLGAAVGSIPLILWGEQGRSVQYGITLPGPAGVGAAFMGEVITTACLIFLLFGMLGHPRLRHFTPYTIPFLYSLMVWAESPLSGCSTNPARSLGPALLSFNFTAYWIYWAGPVAGMLVVVVLFRLFRVQKYLRLEAARIGHHEQNPFKHLMSPAKTENLADSH